MTKNLTLLRDILKLFTTEEVHNYHTVTDGLLTIFSKHETQNTKTYEPEIKY